MTNILLATGDKSRFSEMIETFQSYGCRVNTVDSGSSALAEIEGKSCDLLISDENLPDMTGKTLVEKTVSANPLMDCVAASSLSEEDFHEAFEGMGVLMQFPLEPGKEDVRKLMNHLEKIAFLSKPKAE